MFFKGSEVGQKGDKVVILCPSLADGGGQSQPKWRLFAGGDKKRRMVDILSGTAVLGWLGGRPAGFGRTFQPAFLFLDL